MGSQQHQNQQMQNDTYSKTAPKEQVPSSQPKARNADVHAEPKSTLRNEVNKKA